MPCSKKYLNFNRRSSKMCFPVIHSIQFKVLTFRKTFLGHHASFRQPQIQILQYRSTKTLRLCADLMFVYLILYMLQSMYFQKWCPISYSQKLVPKQKITFILWYKSSRAVGKIFLEIPQQRLPIHNPLKLIEISLDFDLSKPLKWFKVFLFSCCTSLVQSTFKHLPQSDISRNCIKGFSARNC